MKIIIFGNGWLGNRLKVFLDTKISSCRLEDPYSVLLKEIENCDIVINCAAKTNIDWCEENKVSTIESNINGAVKLAELCKNKGKKYVFFSSACIFESKNKNDWKDENSIPNPQCFYSESKWLAERLIQEACPKALIIRPRLPISEMPHPRNTLNKLLHYDKINDNQESVTVVEDMFTALKQLIDNDAVGVFHLINKGTISPAELASKLGHTFYLVSKEEQDERLKKENRAKRVTTYVTSVRTYLLPDINERIPEIVKNFKKFNLELEGE